MKVLSLFDGMSCGQIALERAGIPVEAYYASEIDKYALQITQKNYPNTIQLGDVTKWREWDLPEIDLVMGGSPCQSLSIAKRQKESGLDKGKSTLFWVFVDVLNHFNPTDFLLENVGSMRNADKDRISGVLKVVPVTINSALLSAQQRKRHYWTSIQEIVQPDNKNIHLQDILESGYTEKFKSYCVTATYQRACPADYFQHSQRQLVFNKPVRIGTIGKGGQGERIYHVDGKSISLSASGGGRGAKTGLYEIKNHVRRLTPIECERLQTVPDNYTEGVSNTQRYKMLGNGWTVDVIVHILKAIT
jgi:DNA (cytosine-5)-methyltransferase 3A